MGSHLHFSRHPDLTKIISIALVAVMNFLPIAQVLAFGGTAPTIPNPSVFTDLVEQPRVDGASGAYTQKVSLDIPPGRSGLQPDISLQYNSQQTSDSIVGYGWSLPIPYVQRLNKTGTQDFYNSATSYFTSSTDGELANIATSTTAATTTPSVLDTVPLSTYKVTAATSDSRSYTVPAGGSNRLFVLLLAANNTNTPTATLNGVSLSVSPISGTAGRMYYYVGYLAAPSSGTFQVNFSASTYARYALFTLKDAAQTSPIDASAVTNAITTSKSFP